MNYDKNLKDRENEALKEMEAIYDETNGKIKEIEAEQKKTVSTYLKEKELEKVEQIKKDLLS